MHVYYYHDAFLAITIFEDLLCTKPVRLEPRPMPDVRSLKTPSPSVPACVSGGAAATWFNRRCMRE